MVAPLFEHLLSRGDEGGRILALVPDCGLATEVSAHLNAANHIRKPARDSGFVLAVSGLARATVALGTKAVSVLVATPPDAFALMTRSAYGAEDISHTVLLWPEFYSQDDREPADLVLGATTNAQRIIVTGRPDVTADWIERYARRAPTMKAVVEPAQPGDGVRTAVVGADSLATAVAAVLDTLAPKTALLWDPFPLSRGRWIQYDADPTVTLVGGDALPDASDVAIATDLPSPEILALLHAHSERVVVLHRAYQSDAMDHLATVQELAISPEADRARRAAIELRTELRSRLGGSDLSGAMLQLAPLFDEYDPAEVAAALMGRTDVTNVGQSLPSWVRIRLAVGKKDRVKPGDIVGALINAAHTPKDHVGQIDLRETFTIVEVRTESAEGALRALADIVLRGRPAKPMVDMK